jgi:hypothetical protein
MNQRSLWQAICSGEPGEQRERPRAMRTERKPRASRPGDGVFGLRLLRADQEERNFQVLPPGTFT